jgi:hypothetical protein
MGSRARIFHAKNLSASNRREEAICSRGDWLISELRRHISFDEIFHVK